MYRLLSPIQNGLGVLVTEVEEHIKQVGLEVVTSLQGQNVSESSGLGVVKRLSQCIDSFISQFVVEGHMDNLILIWKVSSSR